MGDELTIGERNIRLETEVSGIKMEISDIKASLLRLEQAFATWHELYPTRTEVNEKFLYRDEQIRGLQRAFDMFVTEVRDSDKVNRINWPVWVTASVAALAWITQLWPKK